MLYTVNPSKATWAPPGRGRKNSEIPAFGKMVANAANMAEMAPEAPRDIPYDRVMVENRMEANEDATPEIRYNDVKLTTPRTCSIVVPNEYKQSMFISRCAKSWWLKPDHRRDHSEGLEGPLSSRKYLFKTFIVLKLAV